MTKACARCGIRREVNESRDTADLCLDCRIVEAATRTMCGTDAGYREHWKMGQPACLPCLDAHNRHDEANRRRRGVKPRKVAVCGTDAGYFAHRNRKETPCRPCTDAHSAASLRRRRELGVPERQPAQCGTYSGERRHRRAKEKPCEPCMEAAREYDRALTARKAESYIERGEAA